MAFFPIFIRNAAVNFARLGNYVSSAGSLSFHCNFFSCVMVPHSVFLIWCSTPLLVAELNSRDKLSLCPWLKHTIILFIAIIIFINLTSVLISMPNLFLVERL